MQKQPNWVKKNMTFFLASFSWWTTSKYVIHMLFTLQRNLFRKARIMNSSSTRGCQPLEFFFSVPFQALMIPILNPAWECGQTNTGTTSLTGKGIRASLPPWTLGQTLTTRLVIRFNLSNLTYVYRRVTKRQLFHL